MNAAVLRTRDAAVYLGVSRKTLLRLVLAGHLHPSELPIGGRRFAIVELDALLARTRRLTGNSAVPLSGARLYEIAKRDVAKRGSR